MARFDVRILESKPSFPTLAKMFKAFPPLVALLLSAIELSSAQDPSLVYSALFWNANGQIFINDTEIGSDGSVYVCGQSEYEPQGWSAFVGQIAANGSPIVWSNFYGGSKSPGPGTWFNTCIDIELDDEGILHAVGQTGSPDFPILNGWDDTHGGDNDLYYAKFASADGTGLYSTFLGGTGNEFSGRLALMPDGGAVVLIWHTDSEDLPVVGGYQSEVNGSFDFYVARFDNSGDLTHSTLFGGGSSDSGQAIEVDSEQNVVIAGRISGSNSDFPFTDGTPSSPLTTTFVVKLSRDLSELIYASSIANSSIERVFDLSIDPQGHALVVGSTTSEQLTTVGAYQSEYGGGSNDGIIARFAPDGTRNMLGYLGGNGHDEISSAEIDENGRVYLSGRTTSTDKFDISPLQQAAGGWDAFAHILEPDLQSSHFSSRLGGGASDHAADIEVLGDGEFVLGGTTRSEDFPSKGYEPEPFVDKWGAFLSRIAVTLSQESPEVSTFSPPGVAINPREPGTDGTPGVSDFLIVSIAGSGLSGFSEVNFDPPQGITARNVRSSNGEVSFGLRIEHGATLGERGITLRNPNNDQEIDVTGKVGRKLLVTRAVAEFNQGNDVSTLDPPYTNLLVSEKPGVVRVRLEDDAMLGKVFSGTLRVDFQSDSEKRAVSTYRHQESYIPALVGAGLDHLVLPFDGLPAREGNIFAYKLLREDGVEFDGPIIKRDSRTSRNLRILVVSYEIVDPTLRDILDPATDMKLDEELAYARKIYPISPTLFTRNARIPRLRLPQRIGTKEIWREVKNASGDRVAAPILTRDGRMALFRHYLRILRRRARHDMAVILLPEGATRRIRNGRLRQVNGSAFPRARTALIGRADPGADFGRTLSHEIGHVIATVMKKKDASVTGKNLGDEYNNGNFKCDANPPVRGLVARDGENCDAVATLENGVGGNRSGTFTSLSSYDPVAFVSQITNTALDASLFKYNFMAGGTDDDESWISEHAMNLLYASVMPASSEPLAKTETVPVAMVVGRVFDDGTAELNTVVQDAVAEFLPNETGSHRLAALDGGGAELSATNFEPSFVDWSEPAQETTQFLFAEALPADDRIRRIVLSRDGIELASIEVSDNAPTISEVAGELQPGGSAEVVLTWSADDADGDSLTYTILVGAPDEEGLIPVATDLSETTFLWDSKMHGPNPSPTIVVYASDGYHESSAEATLAFSVGVNINGDGLQSVPGRPNLTTNFPNPFSTSTTLAFEIGRTTEVEVQIFDVLGRVVRSESLGLLSPGSHEYKVERRDLIAGTYFYSIIAEGSVRTGTMSVGPRN